MLDRAPNDEPNNIRTLLYVSLAGLALMVLLYFVAYDARRTLQLDRWKADCAAGESIEACGRLALDQVRSGVDVDEMRRGIDGWERMCVEDRVPRACRYTAVARSRARDFTWLLGEDGVERFEEKLNDEAVPACKDADGLHCLYLHAWSEGYNLPNEVIKNCDDIESHECAAVKAGGHWRPMKYDPDPLVRCRNGDWSFCEEAEPQPGDHTDAVRRSLDILARFQTEAEVGNPGLRGVRVEVEELEGLAEACDASQPEACLVLGVARSQAPASSWVSPTLDEDELAQTFGRACKDGMNGACAAWAIRLLDQPITRAMNRSAAQEALDIACDRKDGRACWWRVIVDIKPTTKPVDLAGPLKSVCTAYRADAACLVWGQVLAFNDGMTAWERGDIFAIARLDRSCRALGDPDICEMYAELVHRKLGGALPSIVIPLYDRAYSAAKIACEAGDAAGCAEVVRAARRRTQVTPGFAPKSPDAVADELCERNEQFCEWYEREYGP